jgi:hypothetical protein
MSPNECERIDMENYLWEAYKDLYGVKPRWLGISTMSDKELLDAVSEIDRLFKERADAEKQERDELAAARKHPLGIVTLSADGEWALDNDEPIDENDPKMWNWYIPSEVPRTLLASIFLSNDEVKRVID